MMKWAHPEALYVLFGLIPIIGLFIIFMIGRKNALRKMGTKSLVSRLTPGRPTYKHQLKFFLVLFALAFLVLGLANPQLGQKYEKVKRQGVDLIIALDISKSMEAEDEKPNRLEKSKQFISRLIDELRGDRIGLIIFAGNAYLQVPLTSDYIAAKTFLKTIDTELAPTQGTAIGEAIKLGEKAFDSSKPQFKALLVLSDGENHEAEALEAAAAAAEKGTVIHTMGVGTIKGAPIPIYKNNVQADYKRNKEGGIVFSKLNEKMLQQVAVTGNGKYYRLGQGNNAVNAIINELAGMEKQDFEERVFTDYEDQFQWFIAIAIFLLCLEYFLSERKSILFSDWSIFKQGTGNGKS